MKTGILSGIVAGSKTRVWCIFCGVFIPKANKCIEQHTNGARHEENYVLMNDHGLSFTDGELYCKPCKRSLPHDEHVKEHIDTEEHANWMAAIEDLVDGEFISLDEYLCSEKDCAVCDACNTEIDCSLPCIEEHVNNFDHRKNVTELFKSRNGIFSVDDDEVAWCKVCNVYMDNTRHNIETHINDDEKHVQWFSELDDLIYVHEICIESFLTNKQFTIAFCNKCYLEVFCTKQDIYSHIYSEGHLNQFGLWEVASCC